MLSQCLRFLALFLHTVAMSAQPIKLVRHNSNLNRHNTGKLKLNPAQKDRIKKIKIETHPHASHLNQYHFLLRTVSISGNTFFTDKDLRPLWKKWIGKYITLRDLQDTVKQITSAYHKKGFETSYAYIPRQTISNGSVHLKVVESFVTNYNIVPSQTPFHETFESHLQEIRKARPYDAHDANRRVYLCQRTPGYEVNAILKQDYEIPYGTKLTFYAHPTKRVEGDFSYGNIMGAPGLHFDTTIANLIGRSKTKLDVDTDLIVPDRFNAALKHTQLVGTYGTRLYFEGSFGQERAKYIAEPSHVNGESVAGEISFHAMHPFIYNHDKNWKALAGVDYLYNKIRINPHSTLQGKTTFKEPLLSAKLGTLFNVQSDDIFAEVRALYEQGIVDFKDKTPTKFDSSSYFSKLMLSGLLKINLSDQLALLSSLEAQIHFNTLPSAAEISFGGRYIGTAYKADELTGDGGIGGSLEVQYNLHHGSSLFNNNQVFIQLDAAATNTPTKQFKPKYNGLISLGAGWRFQIPAGLHTEFRVSIPLVESVHHELKTYVPRVFGTIGWAF